MDVLQILKEHEILIPDIEWRKIVGLKNVLIHEYSGVNLKIVWDIIENKLNPLKAELLKVDLS